MKVLYRLLLAFTFCSSLLSVGYGQQKGIIKTERSYPVGFVAFSETSTLTGISDAKHVDGYVKKSGNSFFTFPVGQNGVYRPFAADADGTMGAYFKGDPGAASIPNGGPFSRNVKDSVINVISDKEYWDINGAKPTKLTLSWNAASSIADLTENKLNSVTIVAWNTTQAKWEAIRSSVDETGLTGGSSSLTAGSVTSVQAVVPDNYSVFAIAASNSASLSTLYSGVLEVVSDSGIKGWVWDENHPDADLYIELFEGATVYASVKASNYRQDLKDSGVGTGNYGFKFDVPAALKDGKIHQVSVRVRNSSYILTGSPKEISYVFESSVESVSCDEIRGWVWDKNRTDSTMTVEVMEGNTLRATVIANVLRADLRDAGKGTGRYGFILPFPVELRDGKTHQLTFRVKGSVYTLTGSPRNVFCSASQYFGSINNADCDVVRGWAWDKNYPNSAVTVELVEGSTVYATQVANIYRADVKTAGYGTGNYGFSFPMPAALKDGQAHQLVVRVKGNSYLLSGGVARTVTCFSEIYEGSLETAYCDEVKGWIWDKNHSADSMIVELVEGTTVHATVTANAYRADIKNAGKGTGNYGFSFPLPVTLKDGQAHQVSVRVKGTSYVLSGSPKSVTCAIPSQYFGSINSADCDIIRGWVWDKNYPDTAVQVELVEGNTVYATLVADIYRYDVKNAGYGTGNYGYSFALPAALKDGQAHQLSVRVKGSTYLLGNGTVKTVTCNAEVYEGTLETADCNEVKGWIWDKNHTADAMVVELYEGSTVLATVTANAYRADIKNAGKGTGNYGFSIPLPASVKDGQAHQLGVRVKGTSYALTGSPKSVTCAIPSQYFGSINNADCDVIRGWVWDKNYPNSAVTVELIEGNTVHGTALANIYRADVKTAGYGTGNYGYSFALPAALKDGQAHQLSVRVKGSTYLLGNGTVKTVTCNAEVYEGTLETADCNEVKGWIWDKNHTADAMVVELYEGSTVLATVTANAYRADIKNAGKGTGNYGFSIPLPASVKNGQAHQLGVRVKGTSYVLTGSPKSVTCAIPSQYFGSINNADCDVVRGWVWDKNYPNSAVTVELIEGNTVHGTALANIYRADVKTAGYGTGNYGYSFSLPAALKDGQAHQLSVRVKGSTYLLGNGTVKTVTCNAEVYEGTLETADCTEVKGWIWDKNHTADAMVVELYEGSTVLATATANAYRADIKNAGKGTGNYGFSIPLPVSVKDGQAHQLGVRVKGTSYVLTGSPKSVTCAIPSQYFGSINNADCDVVRGWAWDKNYPNSAVTVELVEGSTVYATQVANIYRADVKTAGYGTGNYGFSFPMPAALKDGQAHQLVVRVKGNSYLLSGGVARTVTCFSEIYEGSLETAYCDEVKGWIWDKNHSADSMIVELVEGTTVHATVTANAYRADIKNAGKGTGNYGFSFPLPVTLKDGQAHQVSVRVKGTSYVLSGSPKSVTCAVPSQYFGSINSADCDIIRGWVWDKNYPDTAVQVELVEGSTVYATLVADIYRYDVKNAGYGTGNYGYSFALPAALKDGQAHQLSVRVKGSTYLLGNGTVKTVTCNAEVYEGTLETADCNEVKGWIWDKNHTADAMVVELYEGSTVLATVTANAYRADIKNAGKGTGNYGFSIPLPASVKDGQAHQLGVRVKGTSYALTGSPKSVTCAIPSQYFGGVNTPDCNILRGWVWDKIYPDAVVEVELIEGNTVHATALANIYRSDVKAAGYGTGNYGFSFVIPATLKDGQVHQLSVRVKGSTHIVKGSPKAITCYSGSRIDVSQVTNAERTVEKEIYSKEEIGTNIGLYLTNNPTSGRLSARVFLKKSEVANLNIISLTGHSVWKSKTIGTGEWQEHFIDLSAQAAGTYLFQMEKATGVEVKRIVLVK